MASILFRTPSNQRDSYKGHLINARQLPTFLSDFEQRSPRRFGGEEERGSFPGEQNECRGCFQDRRAEYHDVSSRSLPLGDTHVMTSPILSKLELKLPAIVHLSISAAVLSCLLQLGSLLLGSRTTHIYVR